MIPTVRKLLTVITSEPMTDPFSLYEDDGDISTLVNIATGIRIPADATERLINSSEIDTAQMTTFGDKIRNTNEVKLFDSF